MPSRLSSLLVRDGLIGVKRMERAFKRQVIYGGSLDTILLEMGAVPEDRLIQYLSLATGIPPVLAREVERIDPTLAGVCPADLAREHGVVPLSLEDGALQVLVRDPVSLSALEDLANTLNQPVQPLIVPEYRFQIAFDDLYGEETDPRFIQLADGSKLNLQSPPVGKAESVIIESAISAPAESDADHRVVDVPIPEASPSHARTTQRLSTDALIKHRAEVEGPAATEDKHHGEGEYSVTHRHSIEVPEPGPALATADAIPEPVANDKSEGRSAKVVDVARSASGEVEVREPAVPAEEPATALSPSDAQELLEAAGERDEIFRVLLRAIRRRTWFAGLLTVQGGVAIGRVAINGDSWEHERISHVLIPLDTPSAFEHVVTSASPYIGPISSGDPDVDSMVSRMSGVLPPAAVLLPVVLRGRVVAIGVGHRGADSLEIAEVAELLPLASAAADSLSRLIMKGKEKRTPRAQTRPPRKSARAQAARPKAKRSEGSQAVKSAPRVIATAASSGASPAMEALLDLVEGEDEKASEKAIRRALKTPELAAAHIDKRFPGVLRVERTELGGRVLRAAQHGALLDLTVRLGPVTSDLLVHCMRSRERESRYYATLCAGEVRPQTAIDALVERLFDSDLEIRTLAVEALSGYLARELDHALDFARKALHTEDLDRVRASATALAKLCDVPAVDDLLDVLGRGGKLTEIASVALVSITKHDFGTSQRRWRSWWGKNKHKNRIEWMLEGLSSRDATVRRSAAAELRRLTGEYFGYHHDLPRREREQARKRWIHWWSETGRQQFLRKSKVDERARPTAILPLKRG